MKFTRLIAGASFASYVSSHTIFVQLETAGTRYGIGYGIRIPSYDGPQTDVTTNGMACNGPPNPTTPSDKIIQVKAGTPVTAVWRHTQTSGPGDVMDASHKGPTMAYLKRVTSATKDTGVGTGWFKIQEDGLNGGVWGTEKVMKGQGNHVINIPECIAPGYYLLRPEMLALHGASSPGGAQFYMECVQLNITGGTGQKSPATASLPGMYKASDPGITVNIYSNKGPYIIPGPATFTC